MEQIVKVWFDSKRIYVETSTGRQLSRPLEAFPLLLDATPSERSDFKIGRFGDDIRWECLDEDIHLSSFMEDKEPDPENEIAKLFNAFPQLNVSEIARTMGINKSLLAKYIYGVTNPSPERLRQIKRTLNDLGRSLIDATSF